MSVQATWYGDRVKHQAHAALAAGLLALADEVREASLKIVPRETDALARSAGTDVDPNTLVASVYYDGARDIKTIVQHEALSYRHPPGESAKFLEKPVRAARSTAGARLADYLRRGLT
ncbi:MAG: hypothetical protein J0H73_13935 [Salana multivorans]|uniref:hypothetical protein n=1 Tax=Salana multivorans TaxID=120377 RepID=UPI00095F5429|nr:hypothetical protein [Salana multivorans]MBN8883401.1 hypothetical protein [Salana multivorans]OJX94084.1 MAG: hypothetical protein BGO96_09770 [Micrococcales bacterium 73-15]